MDIYTMSIIRAVTLFQENLSSDKKKTTRKSGFLNDDFMHKLRAQRVDLRSILESNKLSGTLYKFIVRAAIEDLAVFHDNDLIENGKYVEPMR